jgi:hypothetical protein
MAKARKARRPAKRKARKSTKKIGKKRGVRTAKLKGRKVSRPKARRAKKQGVIAEAVSVVTDTIGLHNRLGGHNTFED